MLRALPREKLPEDLSRQVLHAAERRMLSEEEPGAADDGSDGAACRRRGPFSDVS